MDPQPGTSVAELVDAHYALLYRYAYRLTGRSADAEDLTQQTFLSAQANLSQLRDPERAKSWLCMILRNAYLKELRSPHRELSNVLDEVVQPAAGDSGLEGHDADQLRAALREIPEEYRLPLLLFYFEDLSYKEIAAQLNVPMGTVMSRLARGKAWLRNRLGASYGSGASGRIAPALEPTGGVH